MNELIASVIGEEEITALESDLRQLSTAMAGEVSAFSRSLLIAVATKKAMAVTKKAMPLIRELQGMSIGFKVDRQYSDEDLVVPVTEALIRRLPLTGNCFNVIANNFYVTQEGWEFLWGDQSVFSFPDIQIGEIEVGEEARWVEYPPQLQKTINGKKVTGRSVPGESFVSVIATTTLSETGDVLELKFLDNRLTGGLDERIKIPMNRGMHVTAIEGKARCRALKRLWRFAHARLGREDHVSSGADDDDTVTAKPTAKSFTPNTATSKTAAAAPQTPPANPLETSTDPDPFGGPNDGHGDSWEPPISGSVEELEELLASCTTWKSALDTARGYSHLKDTPNEPRASAALAKAKARLWDGKKTETSAQ